MVEVGGGANCSPQGDQETETRGNRILIFLLEAYNSDSNSSHRPPNISATGWVPTNQHLSFWGTFIQSIVTI